MATRLDALLDEQQRTDIGRRVFTEWARSRPGCPRDPAALIESVSLEDEYVGLYATQWHGRRAVWKSIPSAGRVRPASPALPSTIDAWTADEALVRQQSDHVAVCDACAGEGKLSCTACSFGKVVCGDCHGQRKMYGYAANGSPRLLNCQGCRGKGEVDCAQCRRGIATCMRCGGDRRLQQWIEFERWIRTETREHPSAIANRFGWNGISANADVEHHGVVVADVERSRAITTADAPSLPRQWVDGFARGNDGERVVQQRLRVVRIPKLIVRYSVGGGHADAEFAGLTLRPAETRDAFTARASRLRTIALLLAGVFAVAAMFPLAGGPFFWSRSSAMALAAFLIALMFVWLVAAEATGRRRRTMNWLGAALAALLGTGVFVRAAMPDREHIAQSIAAGDLAAAERELNALGAADSDAAWADLRLARIARSANFESARAELARIPPYLPQYTAAAPHLDRLFPQHIRQQFEKRDWRGVIATLQSAPSLGVTRARIEDAASLLYDLAAEETSRARSITVARMRLDSRLAAEQVWMAWETVTGQHGTASLISLRTAMARDVATLERLDRK